MKVSVMHRFVASVALPLTFFAAGCGIMNPEEQSASKISDQITTSRISFCSFSITQRGFLYSLNQARNNPAYYYYDAAGKKVIKFPLGIFALDDGVKGYVDSNKYVLRDRLQVGVNNYSKYFFRLATYDISRIELDLKEDVVSEADLNARYKINNDLNALPYKLKICSNDPNASWGGQASGIFVGVTVHRKYSDQGTLQHEHGHVLGFAHNEYWGPTLAFGGGYCPDELLRLEQVWNAINDPTACNPEVCAPPYWEMMPGELCVSKPFSDGATVRIQSRKSGKCLSNNASTGVVPLVAASDLASVKWVLREIPFDSGSYVGQFNGNYRIVSNKDGRYLNHNMQLVSSEAGSWEIIRDKEHYYLRPTETLYMTSYSNSTAPVRKRFYLDSLAQVQWSIKTY